MARREQVPLTLTWMRTTVEPLATGEDMVNCPFHRILVPSPFVYCYCHCSIHPTILLRLSICILYTTFLHLLLSIYLFVCSFNARKRNKTDAGTLNTDFGISSVLPPLTNKFMNFLSILRLNAFIYHFDSQILYKKLMRENSVIMIFSKLMRLFHI